MSDFDIYQWKENMLKEEADVPYKLDPKLIVAIHKYLSAKLDKVAEKEGDRMSYFSQEYPIASSFYYDLEKNLK
jgi:hypothetical protein